MLSFPTIKTLEFYTARQTVEQHIHDDQLTFTNSVYASYLVRVSTTYSYLCTRKNLVNWLPC